MYVRRIDELPATHPSAGRLGRHVRHDPRSLRYLVPERDPADLVSVRHGRVAPVLNQGDLGSCTGNAAEGCVATGILYTALPYGLPARPRSVDDRPDAADYDEEQAVALYSAATAVDEFDGQYPPDDTGSSGLGVAKACVKAGLISGYQHATSLNAALAALAEQPVITGVNWYSTFDEPDASGLVTIGRRAYVRGGHEFVVDELNVEGELIGFTNSWGTGWGVDGRAYMSWDSWARLLSEDGDVTVFVPITSPAPQPTPDDPHAELAGCLGQIITAAQRGLDILKGKP